jgi:hypothetical protein
VTPYYADDSVTIYHGDCRDIDLHTSGSTVLTDPPYPNNGGHFVEHINAAEQFLYLFSADRFFVFWHQLSRPSVNLPLVAHHVWHRTNTNRPDNYEAIYEFADEAERASRVFAFPVIYLGLTGCKEATGHPTQKPERLMTALLALRSTTGTVIDPFMGSGSTLVAAKRLGLQGIGVEIEERYCEIAARRLSQEVMDFGGAA